MVITCSNRKCVFVYALQSLTGVASSPLVKYYVIVIIYIAHDIFVGGFIGTTKYNSHF
jgi:hypothetical protein